MSTTLTMTKEQQIAQVAHAAIKAYCETLNDYSQPSWEEASEEHQRSTYKGVRFRLENPNAPESAQHDSWMQDKVTNGWQRGEVKSVENKTHPCIVDYYALPLDQRKKDALFIAIVNALK